MTGAATPPRLGIVGGLALDNVITADDTYHVGRPGGNTLWASLGAALFEDRVGIVARAGSDYPAAVLAALAAQGVNVDGVHNTGRPHALRIAYQHLPDGRRLQPVPAPRLATLPAQVRAAFVDSTVSPQHRRDGDPSYADIPSAWLAAAHGWHLPLLPLATHRELATRLRAHTTARIIADCPNRHEVRDLVRDMRDSLHLLDAFLPSSSDIEIIDPGADPRAVARALVEESRRTVVLKEGEQGALVLQPSKPEHRVPTPRVRVVDPTGAGDAFCGAFLVGLVATGDPVIAAMYGTVAGSLAVGTADPLEMLIVSDAERDRRMRWVRERLDYEETS